MPKFKASRTFHWRADLTSASSFCSALVLIHNAHVQRAPVHCKSLNLAQASITKPHETQWWGRHAKTALSLLLWGHFFNKSLILRSTQGLQINLWGHLQALFRKLRPAYVLPTWQDIKDIADNLELHVRVHRQFFIHSQLGPTCCS